jgi:hypothetical protein
VRKTVFFGGYMPADYVPYGPEWQAEMMRMRKVDLVDMVRRAMAKVENGSSHNSESAKCRACKATMFRAEFEHRQLCDLDP